MILHYWHILRLQQCLLNMHYWRGRFSKGVPYNAIGLHCIKPQSEVWKFSLPAMVCLNSWNIEKQYFYASSLTSRFNSLCSVYQFRVAKWIMDSVHTKENPVWCHIDKLLMFSLVCIKHQITLTCITQKYLEKSNL